MLTNLSNARIAKFALCFLALTSIGCLVVNAIARNLILVNLNMICLAVTVGFLYVGRDREEG